ncbi:MAG: hypothetical protein OHK0023_13850 [Anaerolineae bacterium]
MDIIEDIQTVGMFDLATRPPAKDPPHGGFFCAKLWHMFQPESHCPSCPPALTEARYLSF